MATRVFDASAVAALIFGEPEAEAVSALLDAGRRVSSTLLSYEIANLCASKMRRHPASADATRRAFDLFDAMTIEERPVEASACLDLARRTGLTAYDASYLWLARFLDAELVTLDKKLARVAAKS